MELSYFGYWLTKEVWTGPVAVSFIVNHHMFKRSWDQSESYNNIRETFRSQLVNLMGNREAVHMFQKQTIIASHYDDFDIMVPEQLDIDECDVKPKDFITWLHSKGYDMPYEFKVFIEVEEKEPKMTEREQNNVAKKVCQGIAKTLWHAKPDMTITEIRDHHAIQHYGDGKLFDSDTTLHRWLSEVDPRKKKTGPKRHVL